jgi:hypothetical protein
MTPEFNQWWDESPVNPDNPYKQNTPAYWAWEGWCAGVKAEREACWRLCDDLWQEDKDAHDCREAIRARTAS